MNAMQFDLLDATESVGQLSGVANPSIDGLSSSIFITMRKLQRQLVAYNTNYGIRSLSYRRVDNQSVNPSVLDKIGNNS